MTNHMKVVNEYKNDEYINSRELSRRLAVSIKTIEKHSLKIKGRVKIGFSVRYHWPTIQFHLQTGKNLFEVKKEIKRRVGQK